MFSIKCSKHPVERQSFPFPEAAVCGGKAGDRERQAQLDADQEELWVCLGETSGFALSTEGRVKNPRWGALCARRGPV